MITSSRSVAASLRALAMVLLFGLCMGLIAVAAGQAGPSQARGTSDSAAVPTPAGQPTYLVAHLPGPVYDLAYDGWSQSIWFAVMSAARPDDLYRVSAITAATSRWQLPDTESNGFLQRVSVAPDGSVWLTEDYLVLRFDPKSETFSQLSLPQQDPDAIAGALSDSADSPGTWPTAIAFESNGSTIVARHNVRSLLVVSPAMQIEGRIPVPQGISDVGDIAVAGGLIFAAPYGGGAVTAFTESGNAVLQFPGDFSRLAVAQGKVVGCGSSGARSLDPLTGLVSLAGNYSVGSPRDLAIAFNDGSTVAYRSGDGLIDHFGPAGSVLEELRFPAIQTEVQGPDGTTQTATLRDHVLALAGNGGNSVWYVSSLTAALWRLDYPAD